MKSNLNRTVFIIFIIALISAIVTFSNLGFNKEFIGDDAGVGYHYLPSKLNSIIYMWDGKSFPGTSNVVAPLALIHISFLYFINCLGLNNVEIDRIMYFLFFFLSGLGMYFLTDLILIKINISKKEKIANLALLISTIIYSFNNYTMILLSFPVTNYSYSYIFLPWLFLFYLKNYHISKNIGKKTIFILFSILILSGNPSNTLSIIVFLLIYEIFFRRNNKIINHLKNFASTLIIFLLITSYISLPIIGNMANPYVKNSHIDNLISEEFNSTNTSIVDLFRLRGQHSQETFVFNRFLTNNFIILIDYALLILAVVPIFFKKKNRLISFLFFIFIIFIFLSKGDHVIFSGVNSFLYNKIPLFGMYRANWYKFLFFCIFSISLLIAISINEFNTKLITKKRKSFQGILLSVITLTLILISNAPFFTGQVARDIHKTSIPLEYHEANQLLSGNNSDFSILSLPYTPNLVFDWGDGNYYAGSGLADTSLLGLPAWNGGGLFSGYDLGNNFGFYKKIIGETNTKYIILHKDIPESYSFAVNMKGSPGGQSSYQKLNIQLLSENKFKLINDNKYFKIFEIDSSLYKPQLYLNKSTETNNTLARIEYKKINSTKYNIIIHGMDNKLNLIFTDSFDNGWKLYTRNIYSSLLYKSIFQNWFKKPTNSTHYLVNRFQNGWVVDPVTVCQEGNNSCTKNKDGTVDIALSLEFWPQRLFYLGLIISGTTLLVTFTVIIFCHLRNKNK